MTTPGYVIKEIEDLNKGPSNNRLLVVWYLKGQSNHIIPPAIQIKSGIQVTMGI